MATATRLRGATEVVGTYRSGIQLNWPLVVAVTICVGIWALVGSLVVLLT